MKISRIEIADILNDLPLCSKFDREKQYDVIICTLGFEDRTFRIINELSDNKLKNSTLILINYPTNFDENNKNLGQFMKAAKRMRDFIQINYSRQNFQNDLNSVFSKLIFDNSNIGFDISTCSSYVFYPVIHKLLTFDIDVTLLYSEAKTYFPSYDEWNNVAKRASKEDRLFVQTFENAEFLSKGIDDVYPCPLFSEMNPDNRAALLIAVPNFSAMRMNAITNKDRETNKTTLERIHWIISLPPSHSKKWRMEAVKKTNNLDNIKSSHIFTASTLDYKDILTTLENIWMDNKHKYYISIGSLGSKMQHLGIYLFMCLHPDTGLWLSEPKEFRANRFSSGSGDLHQICLGQSSHLKSIFAKYMSFNWCFEK